jgi:hypothetical protein
MTRLLTLIATTAASFQDFAFAGNLDEDVSSFMQTSQILSAVSLGKSALSEDVAGLDWSIRTLDSLLGGVTLDPVFPDVLAGLLALVSFGLTKQLITPLLKPAVRSAAKDAKVVEESIDDVTRDKTEDANNEGPQVSKEVAESVEELPALTIRRPETLLKNEQRDMFGCTALHMATHKQKLDEIIELLEAGSDPNAVDTFNETPLHMAARFGCDEAVWLLLQCGAKTNIKNRDGKTPYDIANMRGEEEVCELLLSGGEAES